MVLLAVVCFFSDAIGRGSFHGARSFSHSGHRGGSKRFNHGVGHRENHWSNHLNNHGYSHHHGHYNPHHHWNHGWWGPSFGVDLGYPAAVYNNTDVEIEEEIEQDNIDNDDDAIEEEE